MKHNSVPSLKTRWLTDSRYRSQTLLDNFQPLLKELMMELVFLKRKMASISVVGKQNGWKTCVLFPLRELSHIKTISLELTKRQRKFLDMWLLVLMLLEMTKESWFLIGTKILESCTKLDFLFTKNILNNCHITKCQKEFLSLRK